MAEQHRFDKKVRHWDYCSKCGLVALKNAATALAMKLGCDWYDILHPKVTKVTHAGSR